MLAQTYHQISTWRCEFGLDAIETHVWTTGGRGHGHESRRSEILDVNGGRRNNDIVPSDHVDHFSDGIAEELLRGLLIKDPTRRLGSGPRDAEDIQEMEFFKPIDFQKLMNGELEAPWKPDIKSSLDTSQFDKEFTRMPIQSPHTKFGTTPDEKLFQGFSFTDNRFRTRAGV